MNYEEAVAYIEKVTKKNSLEHTKECLRRLGNPQEKLYTCCGNEWEGEVPVNYSGRQGIPADCTSPHENEKFQINEILIDKWWLRF